MFCMNCGAQIDDNATVCPICNMSVGSQQGQQTYYYQPDMENVVVEQNQNAQQYQNIQYYQNQQQQYMDQQIVEQQRMINTMLEQQQQMQQKLAQNQQQQYIYVPTKVQTELSIRNGFAIVAAIVCLISLFTEIVLGGNIVDIASVCGNLVEYAEGGEKAALIMVVLMPWIIGGLAIVLLVSAFTNSLRRLKEALEGIHFICFLCMCGLFDELFPYIGEFDDFGIGFLALIVGLLMAMISNHTDSGPKDTSVYAPRRGIGNGVSDSNARSVTDMVQDGNNAAWICPKCDARNTGAVCKVCGITRK